MAKELDDPPPPVLPDVTPLEDAPAVDAALLLAWAELLASTLLLLLDMAAPEEAALLTLEDAAALLPMAAELPVTLAADAADDDDDATGQPWQDPYWVPLLSQTWKPIWPPPQAHAF